MKNGTLSLSFLLDSVNFSKEAWKEASSDFPGLYAAAVLHALAVNEGHKFVGGMWRKAGLQWSQFVPEADVENFITTHVSPKHPSMIAIMRLNENCLSVCLETGLLSE